MGGIVSKKEPSVKDDKSVSKESENESKNLQPILASVDSGKLRRAFLRYSFCEENWVNKVDTATVKDLIERYGSSDSEDYKLNDFVFPPGTKHITLHVLRSKQNREGFENGVKVDDDEMEQIKRNRYNSFLIASIYPLFIKSEEFTNLLKEEKDKHQTENRFDDNNENENGNTSPPTPNLGNKMSYSNDENETNKTILKKDGTTKQIELLAECLNEESNKIEDTKIDMKREFCDLVASTSWVEAVNSFLDDFPISISILKIEKERNNFPFIYINKNFTKIMGYTTKEIIGRGSEILLSNRTEEDQQKLINASLHAGTPLKVGITNRKADGTEFFNLLTLKPVFNTNGKHTHTVGIYCDLTDRNCNFKMIVAADKLARIVCSILG